MISQTYNLVTRPWRTDADGLTVTIKLTPRGGRDSIDGVSALADGRCVMLARVRTVPENGAANSALTKLLAKTVGIPVSAVQIVSGQNTRLKSVHLSGDSTSLEAELTIFIMSMTAKSGKK